MYSLIEFCCIDEKKVLSFFSECFPACENVKYGR